MRTMKQAEQIFESWERGLWQRIYDLSFCQALDEGREPYQAAEDADWEVIHVSNQLGVAGKSA